MTEKQGQALAVLGAGIAEQRAAAFVEEMAYAWPVGDIQGRSYEPLVPLPSRLLIAVQPVPSPLRAYVGREACPLTVRGHGTGLPLASVPRSGRKVSLGQVL